MSSTFYFLTFSIILFKADTFFESVTGLSFSLENVDTSSVIPL